MGEWRSLLRGFPGGKNKSYGYHLDRLYNSYIYRVVMVHIQWRSLLLSNYKLKSCILICCEVRLHFPCLRPVSLESIQTHQKMGHIEGL